MNVEITLKEYVEFAKSIKEEYEKKTIILPKPGPASLSARKTTNT